MVRGGVGVRVSGELVHLGGVRGGVRGRVGVGVRFGVRVDRFGVRVRVWVWVWVWVGFADSPRGWWSCTVRHATGHRAAPPPGLG